MRFGSRKLRAYPDATLTTCPRAPNFSTSSLRMTSIFPPALERGRERQQRDVPPLLDRVREPPLVRRAHARNTARHDFAPLRHEGVQHLRVLVVDIVDLQI